MERITIPSRIWWGGNSCVDKAIGAIQAAGIDFDCEKSTFTYVGWLFEDIYTVGPFGEALIGAGGERL